MADPDAALSKIRLYAANARKLQGGQMDVHMDASGTETRLDQTIKELQAQVDQQKAALEKLRAASTVDISSAAYAASDPRERLRQLHVVKSAYARLSPTTPFLPTQGSALPALLAARTLQQNIQGTKEAFVSTEEQTTTTEGTLRREEANLRDANLLGRAMEARIERLQTQHQERSEKTPAQLAKELIAAKRAQKENYEEKFNQLGTDFSDFVTNVLAPMLAAEELGGPVVGDLPDVEDDTLAVGFTKKGKAKSTTKTPSDGLRQRRIDHIWGNSATMGDDQLTESGAADNEMRNLVEALFATLMGPGGGKAYCELERDSAASRFLVRAKVAQFHPKDANKLRLIDFGRELED